jgi:hypothetical protein
MNKYLGSILLFDVALPTVLLGIPCGLLIFGICTFQGVEAAKIQEESAYQTQSRQVVALNNQLETTRPKVEILKSLLQTNDIEPKLDHGILNSLEKLSTDEVEETLHDFQFGPSTIGTTLGEGRQLSLKLSSRWEALNTITTQWETQFPNLILQSLSVDLAPGTATAIPYLQTALSYFVVTEN